MPAAFHELEISDVREETCDTRSISFHVPSELRQRFRYRAGQYVTLEVPFQGMVLRRCYSLSSAPELGGPPTVTVKRVAGGRVSNWLCENLSPGMALRVSEPEGRFVLAQDEQRARLTLFAAGSGITPMFSLVHSALASTARPVTLVYACRSRADAPFLAELTELAQAHAARFSLHLHFDDVHGLLSREQVTTLVGSSRGDFYVCGPAGFMDMVETALDARGVPAARMHFERFLSPVDPDRRERSPASSQAPGTFRLRLLGQRHTVFHDGVSSMLAAARAQGIKAPSSCEDGYCGTCMAQCVSGKVHMARSEALSARDRARGRVLLCQARPADGGELELDCDAVAFGIGDHPPQPLVPRVVASLFVTAVLAAYFLLRTP